jgi:hypothetical protein
MVEAILCVVIGVVCLVIGILNMRGKISMLHSYHTNNIREEDKAQFGRLVGIGMIVISLSLMVYGVLLYIALNDARYAIIANIIFFLGLVIGIGICLFAIKKYNKKIFG